MCVLGGWWERDLVCAGARASLCLRARALVCVRAKFSVWVCPRESFVYVCVRVRASAVPGRLT